MRFSLFLLMALLAQNVMGESKPFICLGATTIQPIIESIKSHYSSQTHSKILTEGGGSDLGIKNLSEGKINIAMVVRRLTPNEQSTYAHTTIGYDAVAMIVHKSNPIKSLTKQQLIDVYRGKITRWNQIGGADKPIILISKQSNRGLLYLFEEGTGLFHPSNSANSNPAKKIASWAWDAGANNDNIVWTGGLPDAISYISLGTAQAHIANGMPIKILSIDGIYPSSHSIAKHTYPMIAELTLVYRKNDPEAKKFAEYMLSEKAQLAVAKNKFNRIDYAK